ncbi:MAG: hypothetical protein COA79_22365 [Planctomycetota bacterium]|nr:MAG: hypothetical protein COA79_22365 [Planctomycetota bacterium]
MHSELLFPSFQISSIENNDELSGRNCGTTLASSTIFTRLLLENINYNKESNEMETDVSILADNLEMKIDQIIFLNKPCSALDQGYTAILKLELTSLELLKTYFVTLKQNEYISLQLPPKD